MPKQLSLDPQYLVKYLRKELHQDSEWLRRAYKVHLLTGPEIAQVCGVANTTIYSWLRRYGIRTHTTNVRRSPHHDDGWLLHQYCVLGKSTIQIGKECGLSRAPIVCRLHVLEVPMRSARQYNTRSEEEKADTRRRRANRMATAAWRERNRQQCAAYRERFPERLRASARRWMRRHLQTPAGRLNNNVRRRMIHDLARRGGSKGRRRWERLVGYTVDDLRRHLEAQFEPWMTWDNWGPYDPNRRTWQIDHVRPLVGFHYSGPEDDAFREAWALGNLQPLGARENLQKGSRPTVERV